LFTTPLADGTEAKMFVLNSILYGVTVVGFVVGRVVKWEWLECRSSVAS